MWTEGKNKNMNKLLMNFKNPEKKTVNENKILVS